MPHPLLYEINTRCWLRELSEQHGAPITLGTVPDSEFACWKRLGFTDIWLMGVWTTGPKARAFALTEPGLLKMYSEALPGWQEKDVTGSPYAIAAYSVVGSLGGESELQMFRQRLHEYGIKLILDFVPNHVGLDHPWIQTRPELFVQSPVQRTDAFKAETCRGSCWLAYGKDPYFPAWRDTVQLDYRQPATRLAMIEVLQAVAEQCDGVRCDMAMLLLNDVFARTWEQFPATNGQSFPAGEFWAEAIASVKKRNPEFFFLAEVYWGLESRLQDLGFDYTCDKELYDRLVARDGPGVQRHLLNAPKNEAASNRSRFIAGSAHFLENHDERRVASILTPAEHRAAALLILGLPGMRFLHEGQIIGTKVRTPICLLRRASEAENREVQKIYEQLLSAIAGTAIGQGDAHLLKAQPAWTENPTAENFVIIQWQLAVRSDTRGQGFDLVVVNFAPHRSQCIVVLNIEGLAKSKWQMQDLLGTERYLREGQELQDRGLYLDVPEHGAQLFHFEAARAG